MKWGETDKELVQSWIAFKELYRRKLVLFGIATMHKPNMSPLDYGWTNKWGACTDKYFMNRVLSTPEDFRLAHDVFGADVMTPDYSCLNPGVLPRLFAEHLDIADIDDAFDPEEVAKEVNRRPLARYKRLRNKV